jgi:exopolyphosphatase / guanosine-5'-triphosphate,3'-diphosphate pyrophosphatase
MPQCARKYAAIDIGTNSTLLLIAGLAPDHRLIPLVQKQTTTRLGKGLMTGGLITPETVEDTIRTLVEYQRIAQAEGVGKIFTAGTAIFRKARNAAEVVNIIRQQTGIEIQVISGDEEARLTYQAAVAGFGERLLSKNLLVIDIGGGSTELITGQGPKIGRLQSIDMGAVTLTEKYLKSDPIQPTELDQMTVFINSVLKKETPEKLSLKDHSLIGVAGTITTLASIDLGLTVYHAEKVHGHVLRLDKIIAIFERLKEKELSERKKIAGLPASRADIIVAGTAILIAVMRQGDYREIVVSDWGLRYGLILQGLDHSSQ